VGVVNLALYRNNNNPWHVIHNGRLVRISLLRMFVERNQMQQQVITLKTVPEDNPSSPGEKSTPGKGAIKKPDPVDVELVQLERSGRKFLVFLVIGLLFFIYYLFR